jgi:hypothetical protein
MAGSILQSAVRGCQYLKQLPGISLAYKVGDYLQDAAVEMPELVQLMYQKGWCLLEFKESGLGQPELVLYYEGRVGYEPASP